MCSPAVVFPLLRIVSVPYAHLSAGALASLIDLRVLFT